MSIKVALKTIRTSLPTFNPHSRDSRKIMTGGGGGSKVELNPKSKKTPILGHFGTLKNYIHIKHSTLKNTAFFLFNHRHILENYSYIVPHSRHHTLHIHIVNLCFI